MPAHESGFTLLRSIIVVLCVVLCAQSACDTEHLSDPINTIRTQACQSKLLFILLLMEQVPSQERHKKVAKIA